MDAVAVAQTTGWVLIGATMARTAIWLGVVAIASNRRRRQSRIALSRLLTSTERVGSQQPSDRREADVAYPEAIEMRIAHRDYETTDQSVCSMYLVSAGGGRLPAYRPGQFITVELKDHHGRAVRRSYSLSQTPTDPQNYYRISVKRLPPPQGLHPATPGGIASTLIVDSLQTGQTISVLPPAGNFNLQRTPGRPIVLIAGGIGITPLMSMLNWLIATGCSEEIWLLHAVRNNTQHPFRGEIEHLRQHAPNFHAIVFYSQPTPHCRHGIDFDRAGRIDLAVIDQLVRDRDPVFYICGPTEMMNAITSALRAGGVAPEAIHTETFGAGTLAVASQSPSTTARKTNKSKGFDVVFSGSRRRAIWQPHHGSLLEFAEASGITPRFSCRAGQCGSCMVRLRSGKVTYAKTPAVDIDTGSCLPCIAQPLGDLVVEL